MSSNGIRMEVSGIIPSKPDVCAIIFFLFFEVVGSIEIYSHLFYVFGSKHTMYQWIQKLKAGRSIMEDKPHSLVDQATFSTKTE